MAAPSEVRVLDLRKDKSGEPPPLVPPAHRVAFAPDNRTLAAGSRDGTGHLYNAATGTKLCRLPQRGPVCSLAFVPNRRLLLVGTNRGGVQLWDPVTATERGAHTMPPREILALAVAPDGMTAACAGGDGAIVVLDLDVC
jgi:WD40 repeat protein